MILAITYDPDKKEVFQHFGETRFFKLYNIERNDIIDSSVVSTDGQGHCALAGVLRRIGVNALVCGGIGDEAQVSLAELGIRVCGGMEGNCDDAAEKFARGELAFNEVANYS
ncbi:NifB/NifX family molybdenum-iron cluster-binding protein [Oribacterium sp. WCC10]|uniref:NifB/NifX family molybdenum-iron cluster-binding protein n=1 Tax=Oribacterium sp. WCC10 TaxID=1855343 RepID=UPI0008E0F68B|nr:NifB/NifX family molybdenum-iron cluster-binding protein [Oribacterium sp. WCC10]SFG63219.1 Predicted Fe-Mo cluster-binding protein, NifX family [Oribacterium sp. WCC10]